MITQYFMWRSGAEGERSERPRRAARAAGCQLQWVLFSFCLFVIFLMCSYSFFLFLFVYILYSLTTSMSFLCFSFLCYAYFKLFSVKCHYFFGLSWWQYPWKGLTQYIYMPLYLWAIMVAVPLERLETIHWQQWQSGFSYRWHKPIHVHIRIHIHINMHIHMHTCTHAHTRTCAHAHIHTCTHAHMHTCTHAYIYISLAGGRSRLARGDTYTTTNTMHAYYIIYTLHMHNHIHTS